MINTTIIKGFRRVRQACATGLAFLACHLSCGLRGPHVRLYGHVGVGHML